MRYHAHKAIQKIEGVFTHWIFKQKGANSIWDESEREIDKIYLQSVRFSAI